MQIIPKSHLNEIEKRYAISERVEWEYTLDIKHFATRNIINTILGGSSKETPTTEQLQNLNIYSGIWYIVSNKIQNGVGSATLPENMNKYSFLENTADLVANGITAFEIVQTNGKREIRYVPSDEIIDGDVPTRYVYLEKEDEQGNCENYLFVKKYYVGYNENMLYKLDKNSKQSGVPVSLDSLGLSFPETEVTGLQTKSIFIIEKESTFSIIESIVWSYEKNMVSIQSQFLKYLESWLIMRGVKFSSDQRNSDGTVKANVIQKKIVQTEDPQAGVEYVTMQNPTLVTMIDYNTNQLLRQISNITSIPSFYFGIVEQVGAYGEVATYLRLQDFVTECEKYRELYNMAFEKMFEALWIDDTIVWQNVIKDKNDVILGELERENALGIVSKKRMIMQYYGVDETVAQEMIDEIALETKPTVWTDASK